MFASCMLFLVNRI